MSSACAAAKNSRAAFLTHNSSVPQSIQFPKEAGDGQSKGSGTGKGKGPDDGKGKGSGGGEGTMSIEEGRTYDFKVQYHGDRGGPLPIGGAEPFEKVSTTMDSAKGRFIGFKMPPGLALCGLVARGPDEGKYNGSAPEVSVLRAEGQIPQGATPSSLSVKGYPSVDLASEPSQSSCAPKDTTSLSKDSVMLRGSDSEATLSLQKAYTNKNSPSGKPYARAVLIMELQNQNKLDNFVVDDLNIWTIDEDGIVRKPHAEESLGAASTSPDTLCDHDDNPIKITAGPSQTVDNQWVCFPHRPNHQAVALVIQAPKLGIYEVVGVPAQDTP